MPFLVPPPPKKKRRRHTTPQPCPPLPVVRLGHGNWTATATPKRQAWSHTARLRRMTALACDFTLTLQWHGGKAAPPLELLLRLSILVRHGCVLAQARRSTAR